MEILEQEKRRASNLIWNAAQNYDFEPDFKAFDEDGQADLYWNSIIGAVRKNYDAQAIDNLLNLLIQTHKMAFKMLCSIAHIQKTLKVLGFKKDIKSTLVYQLVVVGQQANQAFDQNCC
jgi:hypothetical protein